MPRPRFTCGITYCRTMRYQSSFIRVTGCSAQSLQISGVEVRLRMLGRSLGIDRIHPRKFRRTMATRAIDKGMPVEQVQKILGHSQIDTTMQYAIVNQNNVKESHRKYIA